MAFVSAVPIHTRPSIPTHKIARCDRRELCQCPSTPRWTSRLRVGIVGAGTSGAAAAMLLEHAGHSVTVFERASKPRVEGCGVLLRGNALDELLTVNMQSVVDEICDASHPFSKFRFYSLSGRFLNEREPSPHKTTRFSRGVFRADVLRALWTPFESALNKGDNDTHFIGNAKVTKVVETDTDVSISYERADGNSIVEEQWCGDLVVGADGIRSVVAQALDVDRRLHFLGDHTWRGTVQDNQVCTNGQFMVYTRTRGIYCNVFDLGADESGTHWTHWGVFRDESTKYDENEGPMGGLKMIHQVPSDLLSMLPQQVADLVRHTQLDRVVETFAFDIDPMSQHASKRIVLLGDAAHAMASTLAWGMSSGIVDAVELSKSLKECHDCVPDALRRYEKIRLPINHDFQAQSRELSEKRRIKT